MMKEVLKMKIIGLLSELWKRRCVEMSDNIEVIGIDHGWMMMKTASQVFKASAEEISTEPAFFDNILEYNGKYYEIGCKRVVVKENKTENDNYYLLTLAAIAKELKKRGKHQAKVFLAAGLPLSRFGDEKESFTQYLKANRNVRFKYNTELFDVEIVNVAVFPQCYAAVVDQIGTFRQKVIVVDVGSWTIDIMPIENKKPINEKCISKPIGLITCMRDVNSECYRKLGEEVDECIIQSVMRGENPSISDEYVEVIRNQIHNYVESVYHSLREYGVNLKTTRIVFVGGGASVMRNFGAIDNKNISYILDIKSNAKGFEHMGIMAIKKKNGR